MFRCLCIKMFVFNWGIRIFIDIAEDVGGAE